MDVTSQHLFMSIVHTTSINAEVRKFQALKRYGTQISLDMTLEIRHRSRVIVGTDGKFSGKV